jgi:hypothetical protein
MGKQAHPGQLDSPSPIPLPQRNAAYAGKQMVQANTNTSHPSRACGGVGVGPIESQQGPPIPTSHPHAGCCLWICLRHTFFPIKSVPHERDTRWSIVAWQIWPILLIPKANGPDPLPLPFQSFCPFPHPKTRPQTHLNLRPPPHAPLRPERHQLLHHFTTSPLHPFTTSPLHHFTTSTSTSTSRFHSDTIFPLGCLILHR